MKQFFLNILMISLSFYGFSQDENSLLILNEAGLPVKNVNISSRQCDTILVSDTLGIVDLSIINYCDTLHIRKFGYYSQIMTTKQNKVILKKDTEVYSHKIKILDLKFEKGSRILLEIEGENYWFRSEYGVLLGNGKELENFQEYFEIFQSHNIIKAITAKSEYCLWGIIGENQATSVFVIYYDPKEKIKKRNPLTLWFSKRKIKLEGGCLN